MAPTQSDTGDGSWDLNFTVNLIVLITGIPGALAAVYILKSSRPQWFVGVNLRGKYISVNASPGAEVFGTGLRRLAGVAGEVKIVRGNGSIGHPFVSHAMGPTTAASGPIVKMISNSPMFSWLCNSPSNPI